MGCPALKRGLPMNPTEYFMVELHKLLQRHEKETGTYIVGIKISRVPIEESGKLRMRKPITEINLEIR